MTTTGELTLIGVVVVLLLVSAISHVMWAKEGKANTDTGYSLLTGDS